MRIHNFDIDVEEEIEFAQEFVDDLLAEFDDEFEVRDFNRIAALNEDLICFYHLKFREDQSEENIETIYRCLYLMVQNRCNLLTLANSGAAEEELSVDDMAADFPTEGYQKYLGAKNWIKGILFALIGREEHALKLHQATSIEKIRQGDSRVDDFYYSYMAFLQSIGTEAAPEKLRQAEADLTRAVIVSQEFLDCLIQPQLDLWHFVLDRNETTFNQALENGVQKHHRYWSQKKDDDGGDSYRCNYPEGFVAMNLTAIAAYARDRGMKITYESDYLPRFFIEGYMKIDAKVTMP